MGHRGQFDALSVFEREELLESYLQRRSAGPAGGGTSQSLPSKGLKLDPIPPNLVGCIKLRGLLKMAATYAWASPLQQLQDNFVPVDKATPEGPQIAVSVAEWIGEKNFEYLEKIKLLEKADPRGKHRLRASCGLFGVEKIRPTGVCLRLIFDARPANRLIAPRPEQLVLFTLSQLASAVHRYRHVYTVDYRHYYYQFRIPSALQGYFTIHRDGAALVPTVLPMGFREACAVAQCATLCLVLRMGEGFNQGEVPKEALQGSVMPSSLPIVKGGFQVGVILVLLDGVMIATETEECTRAWRNQLCSNERRFRVLVKECGTKNLVVPGEEVEFAGVVFSSVGMRPKAGRSSGPRPQLEASTQPLREVASRLGTLLWDVRVRSALSPALDGPLQRESMMQLYQRVGEVGAVAPSYRQATIDLSSEEQSLLNDLEREREERKEVYTPWPATRPRGAPALVATDAHPFGLGFVVFSQDGLVLRTEHKQLDERTEQVVAEAMALAWACQEVDAAYVVAAVDADTVRAVVNKAYARTPRLREILRDIFAAKCQVRAIRVAGNTNAADAPSRGKPLDQECVAETWRLLQRELLDEATTRQPVR